MYVVHGGIPGDISGEIPGKIFEETLVLLARENFGRVHRENLEESLDNDLKKIRGKSLKNLC